MFSFGRRMQSEYCGVAHVTVKLFVSGDGTVMVSACLSMPHGISFGFVHGERVIHLHWLSRHYWMLWSQCLYHPQIHMLESYPANVMVLEAAPLRANSTRGQSPHTCIVDFIGDQCPYKRDPTDLLCPLWELCDLEEGPHPIVLGIEIR